MGAGLPAAPYKKYKSPPFPFAFFFLLRYNILNKSHAERKYYE